MDFYCAICDKRFGIKYKIEHLRSKSHISFEQCIGTKHTNRNPDFFYKYEICNKFSTNHNKKFYLRLVKNDPKLIFDEDFSPPIKAESEINSTEFQ